MFQCQLQRSFLLARSGYERIYPEKEGERLTLDDAV